MFDVCVACLGIIGKQRPFGSRSGSISTGGTTRQQKRAAVAHKACPQIDAHQVLSFPCLLCGVSCHGIRVLCNVLYCVSSGLSCDVANGVLCQSIACATCPGRLSVTSAESSERPICAMIGTIETESAEFEFIVMCMLGGTSV